MLTRRSFLASGLAAVSAGEFLVRAVSASSQASPYGSFKMGIQSYSLRHYDLHQALNHSKDLGIRFWESFRNHLPMTDAPAALAEYRKKLADHGITLLAYGVQKFTKNADENRKQFEFARAMGIQCFSADPDPDSFDSLDKLVDEYKINIAIHNHGPDDKKYGKIDQVQKAIAGHHERIGACVDTGHYLRADEDPVAAIRVFGRRTYGVHLKDVKTLAGGKKQFTILGQGELDVLGCLRELKRLQYEHCMALEYEENEKNPISDVRQCLECVRRNVAKV